LSGLILAGLIGGTLTMEVLFGLPGLGTLALQAIQGRDYPVVQAVILLFAVSIVAVNAATDLCQRLIDPRLRR
jgi:peptide/nickel transport system permease protein